MPTSAVQKKQSVSPVLIAWVCAALAAVFVIAVVMYKWNENQDSVYRQLEQNKSDTHRQFNEFADKAGVPQR